ncbi:class I SAM-dependent methyltransferase [Candidatus Pacearchaeota archaeon]|nr:class I SAM-dependent methyltransferase [Candidatus Pacearchaeota archaeon]
MTSYDVIGSIAILKFPRGMKKSEKKKTALELLEKHKNLKTVVEKSEKVRGRLRTIKTLFLAGEKTKESIHNESGCRFKLNIEKCYFSPRLSNERIEVAKKIAEGSKVLVLFAGVSPFSIVIGKIAKPEKIVSVELGRECCRYGKENARLNKLERVVEIVQGDVKKLKKLIKKRKFDVIVMPRPQLKETFLAYIWEFCKKDTEIFYYGFGKDIEEIVSEIEKEAGKAKKKIRIIEKRNAGDIAPYRYRFLVRFKLV